MVCASSSLVSSPSLKGDRGGTPLFLLQWCATLFLVFQSLDSSSLYCEIWRQDFQFASVADFPMKPLGHFPLGMILNFYKLTVGPDGLYSSVTALCFTEAPMQG